MIKKRSGMIVLLCKSGAVWRRLFGRGLHPEPAMEAAQFVRSAPLEVSACLPLHRRAEPLANGHAPPASPPPVGAPAGLYPAVKRGAELALALGLFVFTAPLVVLAMALVKVTSRGPALYWQTRVGRDGVPFTIFKIRTMVHECESVTGARWSTPGDSRITAVGRWLRRTHLDELPQLWNVLRGDMSLVGPRPERPEFVPRLEVAIRHYRARLLVRPGVTGLAQLQLPPDTDLASVRRKLAYDIYYVRHLGLWLDVRLLVGTALKILGVPFGTLRRLLGLPSPERVEKAYATLPAPAQTGPACVHTP